METINRNWFSIHQPCVHSTGIKLWHPNDLKDCYGIVLISVSAHSILTWSTSGWIVSLEDITAIIVSKYSTDFWNGNIQNKVIGYGSCMGLRTFKFVILFSTSDVRWARWLGFIILKYPRYLGRGVSIKELPLSDYHAGLFFICEHYNY